MGSLFEQLPEGWRQVCVKDHHGPDDLNARCANWICPQGLRYRMWSDVQAYFQLLNFEEDIPGVECRPENARRSPVEEEEEITLEEATKKEADAKAKVQPKRSRREPVKYEETISDSSNVESEVSDSEQEAKKNGRKKAKTEDVDYKPDVSENEKTRMSPKRTRRSLPAGTKITDKDVPKKKPTTLEEAVEDSKKNNVKAEKTTADISIKNVKITKVLPPEPAVIKENVKLKEELKASTQKLYDSRWEVFSEYCTKLGTDPVTAPITTLDKFLLHLSNEKKIGKSVVSGYKSAIVKSQSDLKIKLKADDKNDIIEVVEVKVKADVKKEVDSEVQNTKSVTTPKTRQQVKATEKPVTSQSSQSRPVTPQGTSQVQTNRGMQNKQATQGDNKTTTTQGNDKKSTTSQGSSTKQATPQVNNIKQATPQTINPKMLPTQGTGQKPVTNKPVNNPKQVLPQGNAKMQETQQGSDKKQDNPKGIDQKQTKQLPNYQENKQDQSTSNVQDQPKQSESKVASSGVNAGPRKPVIQVNQQSSRTVSQPQAGQSTPKIRPAVNITQGGPRLAAAAGIRSKTPGQSGIRPGQVRPSVQPSSPQVRGIQQTSQQRQQTPQGNQQRQQASTPQIKTVQQRQQTPQQRQQTPQQRQQNPQASQQRQQTAMVATKTPQQRQQTLQASQQRQQAPTVATKTQPRQQTPQAIQQRQQVPSSVPTKIAQQRPQTPQSSQLKLQSSAVPTKASLSTSEVKPQTPQQPQFSLLPSFLTSLVNFPCHLQTNSGGGPSLYRAASQHAGLGQEGFGDLRKHCHLKLLEWWQWYEPYYTFPIKVDIRMKNNTVPKTIDTSEEFQKFLKTQESLFMFFTGECELYCLANVLGVPIYQLTYNLEGVAGKPEERCRWDTLDPHQGLIHKNKFGNNKEPLYILYEDKVHFSKIVQKK